MKSIYDNLNSRQISKIMHNILNDGNDRADCQHNDFLLECLNKPFRGGVFLEHIKPSIDNILERSYVLENETNLSDILLSPETTLFDASRAKSYFKKLSSKEENRTKKEVFVLIYYSLIASSLINDNKLITSHKIDDLIKYMKLLSSKDWVTLELKNQLNDAAEKLQTMQPSDAR